MAEVKIDETSLNSLDNSFTTRFKKEKEAEQKHLAPIVTKDKVVSTKPSIGKRIKDSFFSRDMGDVMDYIINDLIVPGAQDFVIGALEYTFGMTRSRRRDRDRDRNYGRTSYSSYYSSGRRDRDRDRDRDERRDDKVDYRNIVITNREDAEEIVKTLRNYINDYDSVSVSMLLDCVGEAGRYTDQNYGWTRVEDICVRRVRDGYLIDVPDAEYLG
jgi:hypothetical protein